MAVELVLCCVAFVIVIWVLLEQAGDSGDYQNGKACKAPVKSPLPKYQQSVFFIGQMPFLLPKYQCQSTDGKLHANNDIQYWTVQHMIGRLNTA